LEIIQIKRRQQIAGWVKVRTARANHSTRGAKKINAGMGLAPSLHKSVSPDKSFALELPQNIVLPENWTGGLGGE
jgi:hypothetical protein